MISFITGKVAYKEAAFVVLDVSGIGFKVLTPAREDSASKIGEEAFFYTYFSVREDSMELFGFSKKEDLAMFNMLLSVNGIGPKAALSLLTSFDYSALAKAIVLSDSKKIATAQGIGTKSAQRIILELKDKIPSEGLSFGDEEEYKETTSLYDNEAVEALVSLGYSLSEAKGAVKKAGEQDSVEKTVKAALLALMRK